MNLPPLLVLTDRTQARRPLPATVAAAVEGGARAVVLREKDLPDADRRRLAAALLELLLPVGGVLLVAGPAPLIDRVGGVHLAAADAWPAPRPSLVGRSCHDRAQVAGAGAAGCDYVTVSPVHATASKPGYGPPLGPAGVAALAAVPGAPPLYALGGITPATAAACRRAGARGGAVMGAIMRARHPDRLVAALLDALRDVPAEAARAGARTL